MFDSSVIPSIASSVFVIAGLYSVYFIITNKDCKEKKVIKKKTTKLIYHNKK